jgi:predicted RNA-binding protein YlxR (DUF448 family)
VPKPRREPLRTCVACRLEAGKGELVRIVRRAEGGAAVDRSGSASGRGAYLHQAPDCIDNARKRKALDRALKTAVDPEIWAELAEPTGQRPSP